MPLKSFARPVAAAALLAGSLSLASAQTADVEMVDADGESLGTLTLTETPNGVLVEGELSGLPSGGKAFHFHEVGECEPPFESAGGHFNPDDSEHGYHAEGGPHAGDMPNIHVGEDGAVVIEVFNPNVTLVEGEQVSLLDDDGTAVVIHDGTDDYESQPAGDAGDRIACGVVQ